MIQLRREIADELLVHNVRLDEQLQVREHSEGAIAFFGSSITHLSPVVCALQRIIICLPSVNYAR
jgi:hypothetical protein